MKIEEKLLSPLELAELWDADINSIYNYTVKGMPTVVKNDFIYYDLMECQKWYRGEV